jgi:hypothetical protein
MERKTPDFRKLFPPASVYNSCAMPFSVTRQEKRILACLALLIVLGLIGLAIL